MKQLSLSLRNLMLAGSVLSLSACATSGGFQMSEAELQQELRRYEAPASWALSNQRDSAVAADWRTIVNQAELFMLIDEALANNPSLLSTAENIAQSEAFLKQAKSGRLPTVSARLSPSAATLLRGSNVQDSYAASLGASWEADIWGRIGSGIEAAKYDVQSSELFFESTRQSLIAQVARTYISAIEARRQTQLTENNLSEQLDTYRIVDIRYKAGSTSKREPVLAQSDVSIARDNVEVSRANERATIQALEVLIGRYPDGTLAVPDSFPEFNEAITIGRPAELLRRRPDVLRAETLVRAATESKEVARKARWPTLSLGSDLGSNVANLGDLLDPADLALSLGATLADTLFDGGLQEAQLENAESLMRQAVKNYGQTVLTAYSDVEGRLNDLRLIDKRYEYAGDAAEAARETLRLAEIQYREGTLDLLDVITFRQRSLAADQTLLSIERRKIDARIALYLALGGATNDRAISAFDAPAN